MYRKNYLIILRISTIAILSALGYILMSFVKIPYPPAPWLKMEISEVTTLFSFSLFSFPGGIIVSFIKTLLDFFTNESAGFLGIGNITAFLTSILYCVFFYITVKLFKLFNHNFIHRIIGYVVIIILVSFTLTILNALFITPSYLEGKYTTCFEEGIRENIIKQLHSNTDIYFLAIFTIYFPFNLIKGFSVFFLYEILYKRLFTILVNRSSFMNKYFKLNVDSNTLKPSKEDDYRYIYKD